MLLRARSAVTLHIERLPAGHLSGRPRPRALGCGGVPHAL